MIDDNIFNKIYKIHITPKLTTKEPNPFHEKINGLTGEIHYCKIGESMYASYYPEEFSKHPHLFRTSKVLNIDIKEDGNVFIETKNTFYKFEEIWCKEN